MKIAVLLTCYNRIVKTRACILSLLNCSSVSEIDLKIFVVDDGSLDGTKEMLNREFSQITVTTGSGNLFWAGGMRIAWKTAIDSGIDFDYYFLLNDDTYLNTNALDEIVKDLNTLNKNKIILVGSTKDPTTGQITYGGKKLLHSEKPKSYRVVPNHQFPQQCDLGNANIMIVSKDVVATIGILSDDYTHSIADYDYTLKAKSQQIDVCICSNFIGTCENDHGRNWLSAKSSLTERIRYLYSIKGLAYNEYIVYITKYFPKYVFRAKLKLWGKTLFPFVWDMLKSN